MKHMDKQKTQIDCVGVIGLGVMGYAMAQRLLAAGAQVRGHDVNDANVRRFEQAGGAPAGSPATAVAGADVVMLMVPDDDAVQQVLFGEQGAAAAMAPGSVVWLASTVNPDYARSVHGRLQSLGVELIDGPVSGGLAGAQTGQLTVLAGAASPVVQQARPVMQACAAHIVHVGEVGAGSMFKAINQLLTSAHIALTAEALALANRAGLDTGLLVEVIRHSAGNSVQFEKRAPRMARGDHTVHATVDLFRKDVSIVMDLAAQLKLPVPLASTVMSLFATAAALGHGQDSDTQIIKVYDALCMSAQTDNVATPPLDPTVH